MGGDAAVRLGDVVEEGVGSPILFVPLIPTISYLDPTTRYPYNQQFLTFSEFTRVSRE